MTAERYRQIMLELSPGFSDADLKRMGLARTLAAAAEWRETGPPAHVGAWLERYVAYWATQGAVD